MPRYIFSNGTVQLTDSKNAFLQKKEKRTLQTGVLIFTDSMTKKASQPESSTKGNTDNDVRHESQE